MTPKTMAALHARCFTTPRPWREAELEATLATPGTLVIADGPGFAIARVAGEDAELLTIAIDPPQQGRGLGRALLSRIEDAAREAGAARMILEVSAANGVARALYAAAGYTEIGQRPRYYRTPEGQRVDALVLERALGDRPGQALPKSAAPA